MNLGNMASGAANAAGNAANNGLANAASGATNNAANSVANAASNAANNVGNNVQVPTSPSSTTADLDNNMPNENDPLSSNNKGGNKEDSNNQGEAAPEGATPGTKVAPGKEVGKDGQVKDSSTKKLTTAVGQGAAAYFTGGESLGKDQIVLLELSVLLRKKHLVLNK